MNRSIARFAAHRSPEEPGHDGTWPAAFASTAVAEALRDEFPGRLTLKLFGGPHHNASMTIGKPGSGSAAATKSEGALEWEKLFRRCEFINSENVRAEADV